MDQNTNNLINHDYVYIGDFEGPVSLCISNYAFYYEK